MYNLIGDDMKKKILIGIIILLVIGLCITLLLFNKSKGLKKQLDYYKLTKEKIDSMNEYTLNVQISRIGDEVSDISLNYMIEKDNFVLDVYKNGENNFYQYYDKKYYMATEQVDSFEYSNYSIYIDLLKYITDVKKSKNGYTGKIKSKNLNKVINTTDDGIAYLNIENDIIQGVSIVSSKDTDYTININFKY